MRPLRIKFVDFWRGFDPNDNGMLALLETFGEVARCTDEPDYLIYSDFGDEHLQYSNYGCIKIYYTLENLTPNFNQCDYAIGCDYMEFGDRFVRYPLCFWEPRVRELLMRPTLTARDLAGRTKFCNFIYSNPAADPVRDQFFHLLSRYRPVESAGNHLTNTTMLEPGPARVRFDIQRPNPAKMAFLREYKFTIAFENSSHPGYTTEKITDALSARTVPIYWGSPFVGDDINRGAFVNAGDFPTLESLVEEVARIDQDDEAFLAMLNASAFAGSSMQDAQREYRAFWSNIVHQDLATARRRPRHGRARYLELESVVN